MTDDSLPPLLAQLLAMTIEEAGAALTFDEALAAETGWTLARARLVSAEYRRFLYLAATSPQPVTPSVAVDKAWHLHLTYSRHYWDVLCGEILRQKFHHLPSAGGDEEEARHARQYEDTLAIYEATFGTPPPPAAWPRPPLGQARGRRGRSALAAFVVSMALPLLGFLNLGAAGLILGFMIAGALLLLPSYGRAQVQDRRDGGGGACGGSGGGGHAGCCGGCGSGCGGGCGGGCGS